MVGAHDAPVTTTKVAGGLTWWLARSPRCVLGAARRFLPHGVKEGGGERGAFRSARAHGRTSVFPRLDGARPTFDASGSKTVAKHARLHPQGAHA